MNYKEKYFFFASIIEMQPSSVGGKFISLTNRIQYYVIHEFQECTIVFKMGDLTETI